MTYKFRFRTSNGFVYQEGQLHDYIAYDVCVGNYNGIDLYSKDILKINDKHYLVCSFRDAFNDRLITELCSLNIYVNRNPRTSKGLTVLFGSCTDDLSTIPTKFELIGNLHDPNDVSV